MPTTTSTSTLSFAEEEREDGLVYEKKYDLTDDAPEVKMSFMLNAKIDEKMWSYTYFGEEKDLHRTILFWSLLNSLQNPKADSKGIFILIQKTDPDSERYSVIQGRFDGGFIPYRIEEVNFFVKSEYCFTSFEKACSAIYSKLGITALKSQVDSISDDYLKKKNIVGSSLVVKIEASALAGFSKSLSETLLKLSETLKPTVENIEQIMSTYRPGDTFTIRSESPTPGADIRKILRDISYPITVSQYSSPFGDYVTEIKLE